MSATSHGIYQSDPRTWHRMGPLSIDRDGGTHYETVVPGGPKQYPTLATLQAMVADGTRFTTGEEIESRVAEHTDTEINFRTIARDLYAAGAVCQVQRFNPVHNRSVKLLHGDLIKQYSPAPLPDDTVEPPQRATTTSVMEYLDAYHAAREDGKPDADRLSVAAQQAWLYAVLRRHTRPDEDTTVVDITFRACGSLSETDLSAMPVDGSLFTHFDSYAVWGAWVEVNFRGLTVPVEGDLIRALRQHLLLYHRASLATTLTDVRPVDAIQKARTTGQDPSPYTIELPIMDTSVTVSPTDGYLQAASGYLDRKDRGDGGGR